MAHEAYGYNYYTQVEEGGSDAAAVDYSSYPANNGYTYPPTTASYTYTGGQPHGEYQYVAGAEQSGEYQYVAGAEQSGGEAWAAAQGGLDIQVNIGEGEEFSPQFERKPTIYKLAEDGTTWIKEDDPTNTIPVQENIKYESVDETCVDRLKKQHTLKKLSTVQRLWNEGRALAPLSKLSEPRPILPPVRMLLLKPRYKVVYENGQARSEVPCERRWRDACCS